MRTTGDLFFWYYNALILQYYFVPGSGRDIRAPIVLPGLRSNFPRAQNTEPEPRLLHQLSERLGNLNASFFQRFRAANPIEDIDIRIFS